MLIFLRPGRVDMPILYNVERIRDGKSFTTRTVNAIRMEKLYSICQFLLKFMKMV